jgi:hypothetical protein
VIAEGNETPGGESGGAGEGRGRRSEGDLLAERRARRTAESGEHALTLRAEAAEATVRTLETHVASLQQRLGDAEQESRRIADLLDAERAPRVGERADIARRAQPSLREEELERELERSSQREYAEQRLRVEAEDRGAELQRESRVEIERLRRRLSASEREGRELAARLEILERELAEAEQAAATERAVLLRSERALRSRIGELEGAALQMHGALEAERAARRRAEQLLDALRDTQRSALGLLGGVADTIARLRQAALAPPPSPPPAAPQPAAPPPSRAQPSAAPSARAPLAPGGQGAIADAPAAHPLAPAQRLREGRPSDAAGPSERISEDAGSAEMAQALAAAVQRLRARVEEQPAQPAAGPVAQRPSHKHSMSLITRTRLALRRRRERRKVRRER